MELLITDSLAETKQYLAQSKAPVIVDIETTALTIGHGKIFCIAFAPEDRDDVLVWWPRTPEAIGKLKLRRMVAHNAPFEMPWLQSYGAEVRTEWCTMIMAHLINENIPIGLKELARRLLGYEDWSDDNVDKFGLEFGQMDGDPSPLSRVAYRKAKQRVSEYNGMDVHATRELLKWQRRYIKKQLKPNENPVHVMQQVMIPAIEPLAEMSANRLPVRLEKVARARKKVEAKIAEIEKKLDEAIPPREEWPDFLAKTTPKWGNTNWTKWWLYVYQGALCPRRTKPTKAFPEGNPGLSQEDLNKINHPAAALLRTRATLYKQLTGFLKPIEERTTDGRIITSFKLTGTVTGRISSASPKDVPGLNSQQIPRDKATRNLFGERDKAWIECDFSQLELRVAAVFSGDKQMLKLFREDDDIHTYMAKRLVRGGEVTKQHRTLAKGVNFGFLYGMHDKHFASYVKENYGVVITRDEAIEFREQFFTTFNALPEWYRRQQEEALEYGGVHNEFGRFRHLPKIYDPNYWIMQEAVRQAINSPVQSTGSDFMLITLARLHQDLRLKELGAKLVATVHDSVCLTAPYSTARRVGRIVKQTMEQADDQLSRKFFLKADVTISRCWGGEPLAEF